MYDSDAWPQVEQGHWAICGRDRASAASCTFSPLSPSCLFMPPFCEAGCCVWAASTSERSGSRTKQQPLFFFLSSNTQCTLSLWSYIHSCLTLPLNPYILFYIIYFFARGSIFPLHPPMAHHHFEPLHSLWAVCPRINAILTAWV